MTRKARGHIKRKTPIAALRICLGLPDQPCGVRYRHSSPDVRRCAECEYLYHRARNAVRPEYMGDWRVTSRRAREAQPWCSACGTTTDLTLDHETGQVQCRVCNSRHSRKAGTVGRYILSGDPGDLVLPGPLHGPPLPTKVLAIQVDQAARKDRWAQLDQALLEAYDAGASILEIARHHGMPIATVHARLRMNHAVMRRRGPRKVGDSEAPSPR
jgi:hypothetical protein